MVGGVYGLALHQSNEIEVGGFEEMLGIHLMKVQAPK
jgi:hypothetical protein